MIENNRIYIYATRTIEARRRAPPMTTRFSASTAIRPTSMRSMAVTAVRRLVAALMLAPPSRPSAGDGRTVAETQWAMPERLRGEVASPGLQQTLPRRMELLPEFLPAKLTGRLRAEARQLAASGEHCVLRRSAPGTRRSSRSG